MKKVGIVGYGWVGKAMHELFPDALVFSPGCHLNGQELYPGDHEKSVKEWEEKYKADFQFEINSKAGIVFIAVPSPCPAKGKLDVSAVEESLRWLDPKSIDLVVIRSTVNPGDCDRWSMMSQHHICMQPEYLGETPQHPLIDTLKTPFLIIGGNSKDDRKKLIDLYTTVYNANVSIRQLTNYGAEIVKLSENRAIAFKVAQIQELYDVCQAAGVDYYTVRDAVYGDDPRFNLWWTFVYPEKRGFKSKCIPKDVYAWCAWAESCNYDPEVTKAILKRNEKWIENWGEPLKEEALKDEAVKEEPVK